MRYQLINTSIWDTKTGEVYAFKTSDIAQKWLDLLEPKQCTLQ